MAERLAAGGGEKGEKTQAKTREAKSTYSIINTPNMEETNLIWEDKFYQA